MSISLQQYHESKNEPRKVLRSSILFIILQVQSLDYCVWILSAFQA